SIGLECFANLVLAGLFAQAVGNIGSVTKRAGEVAFQNVSVQICMLSAADGLDEVGKMILTALEHFDLLAFVIISGSARDISAFAFDDLANALAFVSVHLFRARSRFVRQPANFKNQQSIAVIVNGK